MKKDGFTLTVRIGNKGANIFDIRAIIEVIRIDETIRTKVFEKAKDYPVLEKSWHFNINLLKDIELFGDLKKYIQNNERYLIQFRFTLRGFDSTTGNLVNAMKYYDINDIKFISKFEHLYTYPEGVRSRIKWRNFDKYSEDYEMKKKVLKI